MSDNGPQAPAPRRPIGGERHAIDLTGPRSHTLIREPGVGSLVIGSPAQGRKVDLCVGAGECIDWSVLDPFTVPDGSPWPRFLHYTGSDAGFFDWARRRPIERMSWAAVLPVDRTVDASRSRVHDLSIALDEPGGRLHLVLPARSVSPHLSLTLGGDLSRISVEGDVPPYLDLAPRTGRRRTDSPFQLPDMGVLQGAERLSLHNGPLAQPVSLRCLGRFPNLRSLNLRGNFCDLDELALQPRLKGLELRAMPDLGGLPALGSWPELDTFIAFNVEEAAGKRLRQQLKVRAALRPFGGHASVSGLRKPAWWEAEFGRPFSSWPGRLARMANEVFDTALAALSGARDLAEAEAAITAFTVRFNDVKGIETTEREALAEAVWQLSRSDAMARLGGTEDDAQRWFDDARRY
ncbi:hypothetical protein VQH23_10470 [Pararoseomonas sp. SCSIO 73927]|uniref:hypothetical protein n=1 Tax=Pararoseomonas sp. SCSIO 73927 TaxID=3114537 RepID=UPI0030CAC6E9